MKFITTYLTIASVVVALATTLNAQSANPAGVHSKISDHQAAPQANGQYWIQPVPAAPGETIVGTSQRMPMATSVEQHMVAPAPSVIVSDCDCHQPSCRTCRLRLRRPRAAVADCDSCGSDCGCVQCPRCEGDICKLELDKSDVTKTCFKVEQVPVCIPAVRLPWQTCCPPGTSETRLVTKLKTHKYKCPNCAYKWKVHEPEEAKAAPAEAAPTEAPADSKTMDEDSVPPPPVVKGAFRNWFRR